jgi:hypothetical protein
VKTNFISSSKFAVKINAKQLLREVVEKNGNELSSLIQQYVEPKVQEAHKKMIQDFESHPVTKEISSGPNSANSSGLLGGYGNLFSFIGFSSADSPIQIISTIINKTTTTTVKKSGSDGKFIITIKAPTKEQIYAASPIPWLSGRSWVDGIEKGISGLGRYLYSSVGFDESNSGTGIQVKKRTSSVKLRNTPYLSKILSDFKNKISEIK